MRCAAPAGNAAACSSLHAAVFLMVFGQFVKQLCKTNGGARWRDAGAEKYAILRDDDDCLGPENDHSEIVGTACYRHAFYIEISSTSVVGNYRCFTGLVCHREFVSRCGML